MGLQNDNQEVIIQKHYFDGRPYVLHVCANINRFKQGFEDVIKKYDYYIVKNLSQLKNRNYHSLYYIIEGSYYIVVSGQTIKEKMNKLIEKYNNRK